MDQAVQPAPAGKPGRGASTRAPAKLAEVDMEHFPHCGGALTIIAAILDPTAIAKILTHLGLSARAPPRRSARSSDLLATA